MQDSWLEVLRELIADRGEQAPQSLAANGQGNKAIAEPELQEVEAALRSYWLLAPLFCSRGSQETMPAGYSALNA